MGTVFKINSWGVETVLHSFTGYPDGAHPYAGLVMDSSGNLYGTSENGGAYGAGTTFEIDTIGIESVLHSFEGGSIDGADPKARLILDPDGNLYGTTFGTPMASCTVRRRLQVCPEPLGRTVVAKAMCTN